jgi:hypothetical protein
VKTYLNVEIEDTQTRNVVAREIEAPPCDGCSISTTLDANCVYTDEAWNPLEDYGTNNVDDPLVALSEVFI